MVIVKEQAHSTLGTWHGCHIGGRTEIGWRFGREVYSQINLGQIIVLNDVFHYPKLKNLTPSWSHCKLVSYDATKQYAK